MYLHCTQTHFTSFLGSRNGSEFERERKKNLCHPLGQNTSPRVPGAADLQGQRVLAPPQSEFPDNADKKSPNCSARRPCLRRCAFPCPARRSQLLHDWNQPRPLIKGTSESPGANESAASERQQQQQRDEKASPGLQPRSDVGSKPEHARLPLTRALPSQNSTCASLVFLAPEEWQEFGTGVRLRGQNEVFLILLS